MHGRLPWAHNITFDVGERSCRITLSDLQYEMITSMNHPRVPWARQLAAKVLSEAPPIARNRTFELFKGQQWNSEGTRRPKKFFAHHLAHQQTDDNALRF